jgi:uncharacterized protein YunC (DUF1805 family)
VSSSAADPVVTDTVTVAGTAAGRVLVSGSHAGETAALLALAAAPAALILHDAGVGCDAAGIAGLVVLERYGVAAAAVDSATARIGDGADTLARGVVAYVNAHAETVGVRPGMPARVAARMLSAWPPPARPEPPPVPRVVLELPGAVGVDSASWVTSDHAGMVVITGSHGGVVNGRALKVPVFAAAFNDAGVGIDGAGIGRLAVLDREATAGFTVDHRSARIGDAHDAYARGIVSHVNEAAARHGVRPGEPAREAVQRLAAAREEIGCPS